MFGFYRGKLPEAERSLTVYKTLGDMWTTISPFMVKRDTAIEKFISQPSPFMVKRKKAIEQFVSLNDAEHFTDLSGQAF